MLWQELQKIALLGTENSSFSERMLDALDQHGINVQQETPVLLAEAAALLAQLRKAGFPLAVFDGELPTAPEASAEKVCSAKSAHHLHLILGGEQAAVLPEFLHFLTKNQKCLPPEHLPELLHLPDFKNHWLLIEPALGTSGRWLLAQHPDWKKWLADPTGFDWRTGSREQRLALLAHWRRHGPDHALTLLESTWPEENPADKVNFLGEMEAGLSVPDEPFLERCLDDRRKEVRQAAASLLSKIPASRLAGRMFQRAANCFTLKNNSLKISILEEPDETALRDGILKIHPGWAGGSKAGHLGQLVSLVPSQQWEAFFEKTPAEIIQLFARTDWSATLLRGTAEAAVFHQNETWATALLDFWVENETLPVWNLPVTDRLMALAPASDVGRLLVWAMQAWPGLPEENSFFFRLLRNNPAPWPDELTLLIIRRLQEDLSKNYRPAWQSAHLRELLKLAGFRCNPDLFDRLQTGWNTHQAQWSYWEKTVDEMVGRVLFRREMRAELERTD
ncbi:MAG: hypothetical protein HY842_13695 [Bacteroidetes bacterium]|nr:hypothetical protein [Bacteroidota bacterium]